MLRAGSSCWPNIYKHSLGNSAPLILLGAAQPAPIPRPMVRQPGEPPGAREEAALAGTPGTTRPHPSSMERE